MVAEVSLVQVRADLKGASSDQIEELSDRLRRGPSGRPVPRRPSDYTSPLSSVWQAELAICAAFVQAANYEARYRYVESIERALEKRGIEPPRDRLALLIIYDATVGHFLQIEAIREGSCECDCSKRKGIDFRACALAVVAFLLGNAFLRSEVGDSIVSELAEEMDVGANFTFDVFRAVGRRFPVLVQQEFGPSYCKITLCLNPQQRPEGQLDL